MQPPLDLLIHRDSSRSRGPYPTGKMGTGGPYITGMMGTGVPILPGLWGQGSPFYRDYGDGGPYFRGSPFYRDTGNETTAQLDRSRSPPMLSISTSLLSKMHQNDLRTLENKILLWEARPQVPFWARFTRAHPRKVCML